MAHSQLFRKVPSEELVVRVLNAFGLASVHDTTWFTKKDLEMYGTVDKLYTLKDELKECYLACKSRLYLNDISVKNSITILRQILKVHGYKLTVKNKYIFGKKSSLYQIVSLKEKEVETVPLQMHGDYLITFE